MGSFLDFEKADFIALIGSHNEEPSVHDTEMSAAYKENKGKKRWSMKSRT